MECLMYIKYNGAPYQACIVSAAGIFKVRSHKNIISGPLLLLCVCLVTVSCFTNILFKVSTSLLIGQLSFGCGRVLSHGCRRDEWAEVQDVCLGQTSQLQLWAPEDLSVLEWVTCPKTTRAQTAAGLLPLTSESNLFELFFHNCPVEDQDMPLQQTDARNVQSVNKKKRKP